MRLSMECRKVEGQIKSRGSPEEFQGSQMSVYTKSSYFSVKYRAVVKFLDTTAAPIPLFDRYKLPPIRLPTSTPIEFT